MRKLCDFDGLLYLIGQQAHHYCAQQKGINQTITFVCSLCGHKLSERLFTLSAATTLSHYLHAAAKEKLYYKAILKISMTYTIKSPLQ